MKYIVYCTTNLINQKIYIGQHLTKDPNIFDYYIGCGVYINKPSTYNNPKTAFQRAVAKYGPENFSREIIKVFDTKEESLLLESEIVTKEFLARDDVYNEVLGGNSGDTTVSITCYQYDLEGNFIAEYDSQQKASYAVGRGFTTIKRAIKEKIKAAGYFWSLEKVNKLDLTNYKTSSNKIPIFQYSNDYKYECCYNSVTDAAKANNTSTLNISRSCKLGYKCQNKYFSYQFNDFKVKVNNASYKNKKVYQYTLSGELIKEYNSYLEAQRELEKYGLLNAIKLGRVFAGYQWSFDKFNQINAIQEKSKSRKVGQYDLNGNLIQVYNTVTECTKYFSGCRHVLRGVEKTSGGYIFKYIE